MPHFEIVNSLASQNRREFLANLGGATAGFAAVGAGVWMAPVADAKETATVLPIVDTHQHLWDLDRFKLPWLTPDPANPLARSFVMKDYLESTAGLGVTKAVYMEVAVDPTQKQAEADYVIDLCQQPDNPMVAAVISYPLKDDGFAKFVKQFGGHRYIKGIRQVLHEEGTEPGMCLDPVVIKNLQLLGDQGLSFDFCMRAQEVPDAAKVAAKCPKTRFILDHCGNMPPVSDDAQLRATWEGGVKALAALPNVVCKISGIVAAAPPDWKPADLASVVNHTIDTFGEDRVMFAADWPVCTTRSTFKAWVMALREITANRGPAFERKLFYDNAVQFYGLKDKA